MTLTFNQVYRFLNSLVSIFGNSYSTLIVSTCLEDYTIYLVFILWFLSIMVAQNRGFIQSDINTVGCRLIGLEITRPYARPKVLGLISAREIVDVLYWRVLYGCFVSSRFSVLVSLRSVHNLNEIQQSLQSYTENNRCLEASYYVSKILYYISCI